jgi:hypothetical protein
LSGGRYWYALPPQHLLGIAPDETPHRLRAIVVLRGRAARPQIDELSRDDVFRLVAERSYFKPASLHDLARMRRSLCDVRALEVSIGEPESAADLLFEALQCA